VKNKTSVVSSIFFPSHPHLQFVNLHRIPRQLDAPDVLALCDEDVHAAWRERGRKKWREGVLQQS